MHHAYINNYLKRSSSVKKAIIPYIQCTPVAPRILHFRGTGKWSPHQPTIFSAMISVPVDKPEVGQQLKNHPDVTGTLLQRYVDDGA